MARAKAAPKRSQKSSKKKKKGNKVINWLADNHKFISIASIIVFASIGAWIVVSSRAATLSTTIDVWHKDAVNTAYKQLWASGATVKSGWTGSVTGCNPGNITAPARAAQINAVNFVRRANNLSPIVGANLTDTTQGNVQRAALMMEANGALDHTPPDNWKCWRDNGDKAAGKSNLALSSPSIEPVEAMKLYMSDPGSSNTAVGHRRWIMYPDAEVFAFGMTDKASAMQVLGLRTNADNNDPLWTMWPSRGWFPVTLEPGGRWSLSTKANITLANATVTVTRNGNNVPITRYAQHLGYGRPTMVWQMPAGYEKSGTYYVTVRGAKIIGSSTLDPYTYPVYFFTPY